MGNESSLPSRGNNVVVGSRRLKIKQKLGEVDESSGENVVLKRMFVAADDVETLNVARHELAVLSKLPPHKNICKLLDSQVTSSSNPTRRSSITGRRSSATMLGGRSKADESLTRHAHMPDNGTDFDEAVGVGGGENDQVVIDMVLEFCNHGNALNEADACKRGGGAQLSEAQLLSRFRDAAAALAHLHVQSPPILHLDVKPENLLLIGPGRDGKLCDFGSCHEGVIPLQTEADITQAEGMLDKLTTLAYRAPELVDPRGVIMTLAVLSPKSKPQAPFSAGPAVDVWALGCLLYRLAFHSTPFEDTHGNVQRMGILNGKVTFPTTGYSDHVKQLILKCLQVNPAARPTAQALVEEVNTILRDLPKAPLIKPPEMAPGALAAANNHHTHARPVIALHEDDATVRSHSNSTKDGLTSSLGAVAESLTTRWMQLRGPKGSDTDKQRWVIKATSVRPGPPKGKYVRKIILDAWESNSGGIAITQLPRRPVSDDCIVALKACGLLFKLMQQGPLVVVRYAISLASFVDGIATVWTNKAASAADALAPFQHYVASYAATVAHKLHAHAFLQSEMGVFLDGNYGMDSVARAAARTSEKSDKDVIRAVAHSLRTISAVTFTGKTPTAQLHMLTQLVTVLEAEAACIHEGLAIEDLRGILRIKSADVRVSAVQECVVGSAPMLMTEIWNCFQAAVAIALSLKGQVPSDDLNACTHRIDAILPDMKRDVDDLLQGYAHPVLARRMDALISTPAFPARSPFADPITAASFLATTHHTPSPQQPGSRTKSAMALDMDEETLAADPGSIRISKADMSPIELMKRVQTVRGNELCAECGSKDATWASVNLGIMLCLRCSGAHRQLGVHISQVRSLSLDKFRPQWLQSLLCIGNARSNAFWEHAAPSGGIPRRPSSVSDLAQVYSWMKDKYEARKWAANCNTPEEVLARKIRRKDSPTSPAATEAAPFEPFPASASAGVASQPPVIANDIDIAAFGKPLENPFDGTDAVVQSTDFEFPESTSKAWEPADDDGSDADSLDYDDRDVAVRIESLRHTASLNDSHTGVFDFTSAVESSTGDNWWESGAHEVSHSAVNLGEHAPWWAQIEDGNQASRHSHASTAPAVLEHASANGSMDTVHAAKGLDLPSSAIIPYEELEVGPRVGVGGFAVVYRGKYRGQEIAIKQLLRQASDSRTPSHGTRLEDEFVGEVKLMLHLRHPNIVSLIGASPTPLCLITEFCARGNLYDALHSSSVALDWPTKLKIALGAASGMAYLHSISPTLIHRDLKSQNIFLMDDWTAKIGDFGLARLKAISASELMTSQCGTFHWMAPELITSFRYTEKVDVYSFGINLWELLTRQLPYEGMESMQIAYAVVNSGLRPPIPADCPPAYAQLMTACWATHAADRPTFAEVVDRLEAMRKLGWK